MKDRCQIKTHLLRDYQASSEAYSKAVVDLSRTIGTGSMFEVRETEVRDGRSAQNTLRIKISLESHTNDHGC
jgi:hypothetical protein